MNPRTKEIYMYILGALVVLSFFLLLGILIFKPIPIENDKVLTLAIGALIGHTATIVGYYFGSSKGSSDKTQLLSKPEDKP